MATARFAGRVTRRGVRRRGWLVHCLTVLLASTGAASATSPASRGSDGSRTCPPADAGESYEPAAFLGYACLDAGCTAHKAGFAWAERLGLAQAQACTGLADPGLLEGCRAFAEEAVTAEQAGFEWARDNEVADACRCQGAGARFEAGCAAYVAGFAP